MHPVLLHPLVGNLQLRFEGGSWGSGPLSLSGTFGKELLSEPGGMNESICILEGARCEFWSQT